MATSFTAVIKNIGSMKTRKLFTLFSLAILSFTSSFGIVPNWFGGTPTVTPHVYSEDFTYGINQVGKVYAILINFNYTTPVPASLDVKNGAITGPSGGRISTWVITVPLANINNTFTFNALNQIGGNIPLIPNQDYTFFFVAEDAGGNLQASPTRIFMKTLPCPPPYVLTGFPIPSICVNQLTTAYFTITGADANFILPGVQLDPNFDGIFSGTTWSLNWGDGTINTYTSVGDDDIPTSLLFYSHVFAPNPLCVFIINLTITNPCGRSSLVTYSLDLNARDNNDLSGVLTLVDNATGLTTIQVCEGNQYKIKIRDNSIWNCQPPVPIPGTPNNVARTLQWVYGADDGLAVQNTIGTAMGTGVSDPVMISAINPATTLAGYVGAILPGITSIGQVSEEITIPASCRVNEYFDVYLRNWNKCNPYGGPYPEVYTHIRILVIASPSPPVAPNRTICFGSSALLTAAHGVSPGILLTWYANSDKTGVLTTGTTYNPGVPTPMGVGTTTYYVADGAGLAPLCEGPVTAVTLTVNPKPAAAITPATPAAVCAGSTINFNGNPTGGAIPYGHAWTGTGIGNLNFTNSATPVYTAPVAGASYGLTYTVTDNKGCTATSSVTGTAYPLPQGSLSANGPICATGAGQLTWTATAGAGSYTIVYKENAGPNRTASGVVSGTPFTTFTSPVTTTTPYTLVSVTDANCSRNASFTGGSATITVNPNPTVSAGGAMAAICQGGTSAALVGSFGGGATAAVWTDGAAGGSFTGNGGAAPGTATYTAAAGAPASVTLTLTTSGGSCGTTLATKTIIVNPNPTVSAGGAMAAICQGGTSTALGGSFGGGATAAVWTDGAAGGSFTGNGGAAPGTATYTAAAGAPASVTLTLTTSGGSCGTTLATKTITVNPNPTVSAGGAMAAICQNGTSAALGGSFGGSATSAVWSDGAAGGSFTGNGGAAPGTATYTAAAGAPASVTLTLTTSGGLCGPATATKTITVNPNPTVSAGGAMAAICQSGTSAALSGSFGGGATAAVWTDGAAGGSFTGNGGASPGTATYTAAGAPASVTLTLTTSGGSCGTTLATKTITVNPNPTVSAGGAMAAICQSGTSATLSGSFGGGATAAVWTDGAAGGSFTGNGGAAPGTATYTAAAGAPASVTLTITTSGGSCGTTLATKTITVNPNPTVSAGGAMAAICQGGTSAALGGSFGGGATSAVWSDGAAGGSFTNNTGATPGSTTYTAAAGAPASVTLTLTTSGGSCSTTLATKTITVNPNPTVSTGGVTAGICQGGTTAALNGSFGGGATAAVW